MKVIKLHDFRTLQVDQTRMACFAGTGAVSDQFGRKLRDLRISVTDRCNLRCRYCMPKSVFTKDYAFLPRDALLSFAEIERIAKVAVANGVEKIRLTGGEPLLRKNIEALIERLSALRTPDGRHVEIAMTTNGILLASKAQTLKAAGLSRVTVSLDALDDTLFRYISDSEANVRDVLAGIFAAQAAGLGPVKVNMVVKRGTNDIELVPMARRFKGTGVILRMIEYMDVGGTNEWVRDEVLPSAEVIQRIHEQFPLQPVASSDASETAKRWAYRDGSGEIGMISSVTGAFCDSCTRARLSANGKMYLCLFASNGYDMRSLLRSGIDDVALSASMRQIWQSRDDNYSKEREDQSHKDVPDEQKSTPKRIEMSYIGG